MNRASVGPALTTGADELDPGLALRDVRRNLQPSGLAEQPATIQFVFPTLPAKWRFYWLVVDVSIPPLVGHLE